MFSRLHLRRWEVGVNMWNAQLIEWLSCNHSWVVSLSSHSLFPPYVMLHLLIFATSEEANSYETTFPPRSLTFDFFCFFLFYITCHPNQTLIHRFWIRNRSGGPNLHSLLLYLLVHWISCFQNGIKVFRCDSWCRQSASPIVIVNVNSLR